MGKTSLFLFAFLTGCSSSMAGTNTGLSPGQVAPSFSLPDLDGHPVSLESYRGKTVVLEWFNPGCPFVKYAHESSVALATMAADRSDDVTWLAINSGAPGKQGEGVALNREAAALWKMTHKVLMDPEGIAGQAYGARTTPHMYIVDTEGMVVYAGALDNAPMGRNDSTHINYIEKALDDLKAGRAVQTPQTKPYGCSVKY
jgi:hypothetical protein